MGCSKIKPNSIFPLLTRPFAEINFAKASNTPKSIINATNGFALVPHGLGMTVPTNVIDIIPCKNGEHYVEIIFANGSKMITDTLEYVGIDYRSVEIIPEMCDRIGFEIVGTLQPVLFTKI